MSLEHVRAHVLPCDLRGSRAKVARIFAMASVVLGGLAALAQAAQAQDTRDTTAKVEAAPEAKPDTTKRALVDRIAVRFYSPETGGSARPRFITERMLGLEARFEALSDGSPASAAYQERYVRAAMERHVAEEILAALMVEQGTEPPNLPRLVDDWRLGLEHRLGGPVALRDALTAEGIEDAELETFFRRRVRAAYYVDRAVAPILHPSDEQLREVYRTVAHPFKALKFDDARTPLLRWIVAERLRVAETEFLQAARTRVKIIVVPK